MKKLAIYHIIGLLLMLVVVGCAPEIKPVFEDSNQCFIESNIVAVYYSRPGRTDSTRPRRRRRRPSHR